MPTFNIKMAVLMQVDPVEFLENATGCINLELDDGECVEIDHVAMAWSLFGTHFHRKYNTPFRKAHLINQYFDKIGYSSKAWSKWINVIFWDTYDHVLNQYPETNDRRLFNSLCKDFIYVYGMLYSNFISASRPYMLSVSVKDCYETYHHPEMVALRNKAIEKQTPSNVSGCIDDMNKLMTNPDRVIDNAISLLCRIGGTRVPNTVQCLGLVGYRYEVNGDVFKYPLLTTYLKGFTTPYSILIESRTSCISTLATYGELRNSEYSARKTQLALVSITGIDGDDCGTNITTDVYMNPENISHMLKITKGANYKLPDGSIDWIRGDEKHLAGSVIKVFTPASCRNPKHTGKVCRKCYGKMYESHHRNLHLGYCSSTSSSSNRSQGSMSKKHSIGSAKIVGIDFTPDESKFVTQIGTSDYAITDYALKLTNVVLKVPMVDSVGLGNILFSQDIGNATEESVSTLDTVYFAYVDKEGFETEQSVGVHLLKNKSYLSYEMIRYVHENRSRVCLDKQNMYCIPLDKWNSKKPAFVMPAVTAADATDLDAIYESLDGRLSALQKRGVAPTASGILSYVIDLLCQSGTHINDIAVTTMAILSEDPNYKRFNIGETGIDSIPTPLLERVMGMSAGVALAFERQHILNFKVSAMLPSGRVATPLDVVLNPSIINRYYR